jgi:hypothetical protein
MNLLTKEKSSKTEKVFYIIIIMIKILEKTKSGPLNWGVAYRAFPALLLPVTKIGTLRWFALLSLYLLKMQNI